MKPGLRNALGALLLLLGVGAIVFPLAGSVATTVFIGVLFISGSVLRLLNRDEELKASLRTLDVLGGIVGLVAGALLIAFPLPGILTLTLVVAAYFAAQGVMRLVAALTIAETGRGWLGLTGALDLGLGLLVFLEWPTTAIWFLGLLLGVHLILNGVALLAGARIYATVPRLPREPAQRSTHSPAQSHG